MYYFCRNSRVFSEVFLSTLFILHDRRHFLLAQGDRSVKMAWMLVLTCIAKPSSMCS
jgi:hypothetical protein